MSTPKKNLRRKSIQYSDPGKILDLVLDLTDYCCANLQVKLNNYLKEESESELVLQVTVNAEHVEASIETVGGVVLQRKRKLSEPQKFVDLLKSNVEQSDLLPNFPPDFQQIVHLHLPKEHPKKRVVMIPIVDKPFSVIVCVISAKILDEHVAALVQECFLFCWPTLSKCIALEYERKLKEKCQQLLRVARRLFTQVASLKTLLHIAMEQAKQLTKAEHCSVMLVDQERMEFVEAISEQESDNVPTERRLPLYKGIAGLALKTGCLVNAKNPKEHPNYDPEIDCCPNVDCKNILCFPIRDQTGIIGVGMLINKVYDPYFDAMDEEMALAFSIYCGVCIVHSVVYQKIQEAHIRNSIANELVMYHMKVHDTEVARVAECTGFHNHPHLSSLHFNLRALPLRELPCYVIKMFTDLGFERQFNIKREKFIRFVLHVKKGYRDVPYHNWLHGFSVTQWAYSALINFKIVSKGYFTELQALMYFISALVHDLDHRGTTNSFHIQGQTTLAALYSSEGSVMERHHLAQAMCILNTEGCDILESLPRRDYDRALMLLRDFILASDLANFFKNLNEYKIISADYQKGNRAHAAALQALLMNAADLSDQLKDWNYIKKTAAAVLSEFFKQGDVEKRRGELPAVTMDREKCFIPELQIHFLTSICVPLFELLGIIIPKAVPCVKIIENHIERWEGAKPVFAEVPHTAGLSILLSPELDTLIEQNIKEKERLRTEGDQEDEDK